jgi:TatD-related deoxyribonuclease
MNILLWTIYNYVALCSPIMANPLPIYDNHFHMSPSGRNTDALLEFRNAGGTGITLVTLPYKEVPISSGEDFRKSFQITYELAEKARDLTDLEVNVAVGPYPIILLSLEERFGLEKAEEIMMRGMEYAAEDVAEGRACAIGEIGRPHFETDSKYVEASNRILLRGMELAKEQDVPVIIHCESGSVDTNRSLSDLAKQAGLKSELVVKHSSPPFVTDEETFGVMPSIPASKSNIKEALSKGTTRFMIETDFIDDPLRPALMMPPATVPKKVNQMLASGLTDEEGIHRICGDIPDSLYHR